MVVVEEHPFLVLLRRAQALEHRALCGVNRLDGVIAPIEHQDRLAHTRDEVDLIHLGLRPPRGETGRDQNRRLEPRLNGRNDGAPATAPAKAEIGQRVHVDIASSVQVLDRAQGILNPVHRVLAVAPAFIRPRRREPIPSLERAAVHRDHEGAAALEHERRDLGRGRRLCDGIRPGKEDHRLIRGCPRGRQIHVDQHPARTVGRVHGDLFQAST